MNQKTNNSIRIMKAVSEVYYKDMCNIIIQCPTQDQADRLEKQIQSVIDEQKGDSG